MSNNSNNLGDAFISLTNSGGNVRRRKLVFTGNSSVSSTNDEYQVHIGRSWKEHVRVKTVTNLPTYSQSGIGNGATLTAVSNGSLPPIDGVTLNNGDRLLVDQDGLPGDPQHAGIYVVTDVGSGSTPWILTRSADMDENSDYVTNVGLYVSEGTQNGGNSFVEETSNVEVDITPQNWVTYLGQPVITGSNAGTGEHVYSSRMGNQLIFRSLKSDSSNSLSLNTTGPDEIEFGVNVSSLDHNNLSNLTVGDPHSQYLNLLGRNGGQIINGGNLSGDNLHLNSTSDTTKGSVIVNDTADTSGVNSGALQVRGGLSVDKKLYVDDTLTVNGNANIFGTVNGIDVQNLNNHVSLFNSQLQNLSSQEIQQLENIDSVLINNTNWQNLGNLNQNVGIGQNVSFGTIVGTIINSNQPSIDHNTLSNLSAGDPHTQYLYLNGRPGGQAIYGAQSGLGTLELYPSFSGPLGSVSVPQATSSTSTSTGCLVLGGGLGLAENINLGGNLTANGSVNGSDFNGIDINSLQADLDGFPDELKNLSTDEILQLQNINTQGITNLQWQQLSNSDNSNGLAVLDASQKIKSANIPFGTSAGTVLEGNYSPPGRNTENLSFSTGSTSPVTLNNLDQNYGSYQVQVTGQNANSPSAIFHIVKSQGSTTDGQVVRSVSFPSSNGVELGMDWLHSNGRPNLFHQNPDAGNTGSYEVTILF